MILNKDEILFWIPVLLFTIYLIKSVTSGTYYKGKECMKGKVVIITGANSGIGFETALDLSKRGAVLILACRNKNRGTQAQKLISQSSNNDHVDFISLDLCSFLSIRNFVNTVKKKYKSVNLLINNAGIIFVPHSFTKENFELNFGVNYLGHFLLTLLLLPLLCNQDNHSRIISVSSIMYMFGDLHISDLNFVNRRYNTVQAYSDSKLSNLLISKLLAERIKTEKVSTYCVDPGVVYSDIGKDSWFMSSFLYKIVCRPITWLLFKDTHAGAQTTIYCACNNLLEKETAEFYCECKKRCPWCSASNMKVATKLWDKSIQLVQLKFEEKKEISKYLNL